jgi:ABC-type transporter MlaC component
MIMKKRFILLLLFLFIAGQAFGTTPEQVVKKLVNAIKLKKYGENLTEADRTHNLKMTRIAATCFDLDRMTQSALVDYWSAIAVDTQELLVKKIKDLVIKMAYPATNPDVQKIQIVYKGQEIEGTEAVVHSLLIMNDKELKIDYKLYKVGKDWLIYDIISEQVSLIDGYKKQFNRIIKTYSVDKLIAILDQKLEGN